MTMDHAAHPAPRFAGQVINLGGTDYTVPPLALGALKVLLPKIRQFAVSEDGATGLEHSEDLLEVCLAVLRRNYPSMTLEELIEIVDLSNFGPLTLAVMGQSGLVKTDAGKAAPVTDRP